MSSRAVWLGWLAAISVVTVLGCSGRPPHPTAPSPTGARGTVSVAVLGRPFTLHVPDSYRPADRAPLVILLHGYSATGATQESYFRITPESDRLGFLYAYPDGLVDPQQKQYWNATDACCDLWGSNVDDSGYLSAVIARIEALYRVDQRRVYLVGHSNGAFMAFRMACDHADQITAIAALNGAMWQDAAKCRPSTSVSVLDIRSTSDETIAYGGGQIVHHPYPSAAQSDSDWLALDGCANAPVQAPALDLVTNLPGGETSVLRYPRCTRGATVETWTIKDGTHVPALDGAFAADVTRFLLAQTKP